VRRSLFELLLRGPRSRGALVVAAPVLLLCTVGGEQPHQAASPPTGGAAAVLLNTSLPSIGGGPPGGVRASASTSTPTAYGDCGPGAIREDGLQGQVSKKDQDDGRSKLGARCNLRLVGSNDVKHRGANFQLGWYKHCGYVGSVGARDLQTTQGTRNSDNLDGLAVIDAADPRHPKLVKIVREPGGVSQHEAIEVNPRRGMLVVQTGGLSAEWIDIYDVSKDCRNPIYKGRYDAGHPIFHGQRISADGKTVYATDYTGAAVASGGVMHIVDVSDMSHPKLIMRWDPTHEIPPHNYGIHDLDVSPDGKRAYLGAVDPSATQGALIAGPPSNTGPTMVVIDTSDIQARKPNPDIRVIGQVNLPNFGHTEQRATINGKPYLLTSGETPFIGADNCPWAWGNILDMSDEKKPKSVAEIKLAVNEQSNCGTVGPDDSVYSIHYIGVDDPDHTTMVFYTYYAGGVRIFDIRNPSKPKEIAYYHPPPITDTVHKPFPRYAGDYQGPTFDSSTSDIRYFPKERRLWFVSIGRGFQVLQLTKPQLSLAVAPETTRAGRRTRFRFSVTSGRDHIAGATVRLGGKSTQTDSNGRASITLTFHGAGSFTAKAGKQGYVSDSAAIRVLPASAGSLGGGSRCVGGPGRGGAGAGGGGGGCRAD
jgi:hypothetical protein